MSEPPRKRGRPRGFDPALALASATATFARHGFSGSSLEDLTAAMALSKPSLYAAFGDKRALYLRALAEHAAVRTRRYAEAFGRGVTVEAALRGLFEEAVAVSLAADGAPGCLIASSATSEAVDHPEVAAFTRDFFASCDRALAKGVRARLVREGAVAAATIARLATGVVNDLALRARVGEPRARLLEHARAAAAALALAAAAPP
ncbi:MAG: TetR/AcrR family transcriptional regulator [Kofleriaceae bacterium]